jgi:hypothetical protein
MDEATDASAHAVPRWNPRGGIIGPDSERGINTVSYYPLGVINATVCTRKSKILFGRQLDP